MIVEASLSTLIFIPIYHAGRVRLTDSKSSSLPASASRLAQTTLHILLNLSFVISRFGGFATTGQGVFFELRKASYLALDILATDKEASETFVHDLCSLFGDGGLSLSSHENEETNGCICDRITARAVSLPLQPRKSDICTFVYRATCSSYQRGLYQVSRSAFMSTVKFFLLPWFRNAELAIIDIYQKRLIGKHLSLRTPSYSLSWRLRHDIST
jgi:hypothetical protein